MNSLNNNKKIYSILVKKIQCILFIKNFKLNYYKDSIIQYIDSNKNYNNNINDLETNINISNKEYKYNKYILENTTNKYNLLTRNKNILNNNNITLANKINEIISLKKNIYIRLILTQFKNNYYNQKLLLETNNKNDNI